MNEMITPLGQVLPLQGGNLARVARFEEALSLTLKHASMHLATARA